MNSDIQGHSNSSQSLPSISVNSGQQIEVSKPRSTSYTKLEDGENQDNESIEIVNIALDNNKLPKMASADGLNFQEYQDDADHY